MKKGSASLITALLCAAAAGAGYKTFMNSDSGLMNAAPWLLLTAAFGLLTFSVLKLERSRSFGDLFGLHVVLVLAVMVAFGIARTVTIPWSYSSGQRRLEKFDMFIQGVGIILVLAVAGAVVMAIIAQRSKSSTQ